MTRPSVLQCRWVCYWQPLPCPDVKPAVVAEEWTSTWVSILILLPQFQVMSPSWIQWWVVLHCLQSPSCTRRRCTLQYSPAVVRPPLPCVLPSPHLMSHFLRLWCDAIGEQTPASCTPSGRSNHCATRGSCGQAGAIGIILLWYFSLPFCQY